MLLRSRSTGSVGRAAFLAGTFPFSQKDKAWTPTPPRHYPGVPLLLKASTCLPPYNLVTVLRREGACRPAWALVAI